MPDSFELPELDGLDATALQAIEAQATEAFNARYAAGATTEQDLDELKTIAEGIQQVRAAIVTAQATAEPEPEPVTVTEPADVEGANKALEAYLEKLTPPAAPEPVVVEPPAPVAVEPPVVEHVPATDVTVVAEPAPDAIAASGDPKDVQLPVSGTVISIRASADIPGIGVGAELDGWDGLVKAVNAKAASLPDMPGQLRPFQVASIMKPMNPERFVDDLNERQVRELINDLSSPRYLLDQLSASGGWCSPNERIWEFACLVEAPPDELDLPMFGLARRGGLDFPISPTFRDFKTLENNGLFTWTEADDIAAATGSPTKPCFKVPCVEFDSARLELEGLCVTAGNLMDFAYPELIRRYLSLVLTAHLHRMNTQRILKMLAFADDHVTLAATFATASAIFDSLLLQTADMRDQFSMSVNALIEVVMPRWLRAPARADVARRECCSIDSVSDADVLSFWQSANARIQFVSNWQELGDPDNPALLWPTTVDYFMMLPGAVKELGGPKLDIAVTRDSIQNETNDFTVAFTEEGYQVFRPGCGTRLVTVPICPSGASGERVALSCES